MFLTFLLIFIGVSKYSVALSLDIQWYLNQISDEFTVFDKALALGKRLEVKAKLNKIFKFHYDSLR